MARRRATGEGSVYYDRDRDRWIGAYMLANGQRRKVVGHTRTEARQRLDRLRHTVDAGEVSGDGNATVGDAVTLWRSRVLAARRLAPATRVRYEHHCRIIAEHLGRRRLAKLTADDVEAMLDQLAAARPTARDTLVKVRSTIVQILDFAARRGLVARNPAIHATVPANATPSAKRRSLTSEQARTLYGACDGEHLAPMIRLGLLIGLRPGELTGLRWRDVDLKRGTLTTRHAIQMHRGRPVLVDVLKTESSYRTIGLPANATALLTKHRTEQRRARLTGLPTGNGLVFPSRAGTPVEPRNFRRELARICTDAAVPIITPNELRHTCATLLNDDGVPLELIADMLGHTSTVMLQRHYRHRVRPSADAAVGPMERMFAGA